MPPQLPQPQMDKITAGKALASTWAAGGDGASAQDIEGWHSEQIVVMLDELLLTAKTLPVRHCL